jgi:hypothetical protein
MRARRPSNGTWGKWGWRARRFLTRTVRVVVLALLAWPLVFSATLPMAARLIAGERLHICRCETSHGDPTCACPICHPDDPEYRLSEESIRGKCGDDDVVFGARHGLGVLPAVAVPILPGEFVALRDDVPAQERAEAFLVPPTPPPRSQTFAT